MGTWVEKKMLIIISAFWVLLIIACNPNQQQNAPGKETAFLTMTSVPMPLLSEDSSATPQLIPSVTATPPVMPTSTPWPTVDPTLYATLYVTPTFTFSPTPNYYASMKSLYRQMVGEWWGKIGVTVNRQGRRTYTAVVVFEHRCEMGQICGRYHFDDGCFGELVLGNWRPTFLVFRNLEYSGKTDCPKWIPMNVRPLHNDRLSFTFSYRNEEGKRVNKGIVLRRK